MINFIDDYRSLYGVESICHVLPIAPSTYYQHRALPRNLRERWQRAGIQRVWEDNVGVSTLSVTSEVKGTEAGTPVARCTVVRLMHQMERRDVIRHHKCRLSLLVNRNRALRSHGSKLAR